MKRSDEQVRRLPRWLVFLIAAFVAVGGVIAVASPVSADSTLCSGNSFSNCINAGYTAHGYENHYTTSYWRAYAGHNCTNYVGYMLTQNGDAGHGVAMGNAGEWDNTIAAHPEWGYTMDGTPTVGSIAQWDPYAGSTGWAGHVAYVERVSANSITVSEDNYSTGPFRWRVINVGSSEWPTRFLHIKDVVTSEPTPPQEVKGDLTYDGRADLVGISKASDGTPYVNVFEAGPNTFQAPSQWAHPTTGWSEWDTKVWLTGSVGNDTATDLIGISKASDGTPYIHVFPSRGSSFGSPILWSHPTTGWSDWDGKRWLMGDVTGDGKEDLIGISRASNGSAYVHVFRSTGSSFAAPVQWIHASSWTNWDAQEWLVEDFGGDGKEDLMLIIPDSDGTPLINVFPSRGNSFGSPSLWAHPTDGWEEWETKVWLVGNFGTDNAADLLGISKASDGTPYIHVFPSRGSQNRFGDPQLWAHPTTSWEDWEGKRWVVNDYGTDGKEDLIGISRAVDGPYIHVFPSRGDVFGSPSLWSHPTTGWTEWETKVWL